MTTKKFNVSLEFQANVSHAQQSLQKLQSTLNSLATKPINIDSGSISQATQAAQELQYHLNAATNVNTGRLDLSKFSASLSSANQNLSTLSLKLTQAGVQGKNAFVQLAQSISMAERPAITLGETLTKIGTTLANTIRWQLSSSAINAVAGAIQTAWNYAKDLNESLTNIRIVTGYSADEMAKFAVQANKTAQALKASTVAYTDAALIYYQQGTLSQEQVAQRAAITMKLAQVTGQSVTTVSEQMTAVWNNFYDGSKSLEYYADVLTALGASTASSTQEITEGLEKFAAIGNTIGLSYEYAASALATVTATTKQSAEVVGTAFKTLFARIQDLELGETLEDGVTLGTYSQALDAVGVKILDANGQLRAMDDILKDMAATWENLTKAQQTSLAQTVAGVRQYTQLVTLMENWDFMETNIQTAVDATGELNKQQEIYAEGWKAASQSVKTAAEGLYQQVINDKAIIKVTNAFADLLEVVSSVVKNMGGLKVFVYALLPQLASIIMKKVVPAWGSLRDGMLIAFGQGATVYKRQAQELEASVTRISQSMNFTNTQKQQLANAQNIMNAQSNLEARRSSMSAQAVKSAELEIEGQKRLSAAYDASAAAIEANEADIISTQQKIEAARDAAQKKAEQKLESELKALDEAAKRAETSWATIRGTVSQKSTSNRLGKQRETELYKEFEKTGVSESTMMQLQDRAGHRASALQSAMANVKNNYAEQLQNDPTGASLDLQQILEPLKEAINKFTTVDLFTQEDARILATQLQQVLPSEAFSTKNANVSGIQKDLNNLIAGKVNDRDQSVQILQRVTQGIAGSVKQRSYSEEIGGKKGVLARTIGISDADLKKLEAANDERINSQNQLNDQQNQSQAFIEQEIANNETIIGLQTKQDDLMQRKKGLLQEQQDIINSNAKSMERFNNTLMQGPDMAQTFNAAMSSLSSIAMAIPSIISMVRTLKDETASTGDQILSVIMTTSIALPALVNAIKNSATVVRGVVAAVGKTAAAAMGWIALLVAALVGAILLIRKLADTETDLEKATKTFEQQTKALEIYSNAANSASEAVSSLQSAWEQLSSTHKNLDSLIKGTTEWKQALVSANSQVVELLDKYPELASTLEVDEDGLMTINPQEYNRFLDTQIDKQQDLLTQKNAQQIIAQIAEQQVAIAKEAETVTYGIQQATESGQYSIQAIDRASLSAETEADVDQALKKLGFLDEDGLTKIGVYSDPQMAAIREELQKTLSDSGKTAEEIQEVMKEFENSLEDAKGANRATEEDFQITSQALNDFSQVLYDNLENYKIDEIGQLTLDVENLDAGIQHTIYSLNSYTKTLDHGASWMQSFITTLIQGKAEIENQMYAAAKVRVAQQNAGMSATEASHLANYMISMGSQQYAAYQAPGQTPNNQREMILQAVYGTSDMATIGKMLGGTVGIDENNNITFTAEGSTEATVLYDLKNIGEDFFQTNFNSQTYAIEANKLYQDLIARYMSEAGVSRETAMQMAADTRYSYDGTRHNEDLKRALENINFRDLVDIGANTAKDSSWRKAAQQESARRAESFSDPSGTVAFVSDQLAELSISANAYELYRQSIEKTEKTIWGYNAAKEKELQISNKVANARIRNTALMTQAAEVAKEYEEALSKVGTADYYEGIVQLQKVFKDFYGMSFDAQFIEDNLELIKEIIATGSEEKYQEFSVAAASQMLAQAQGKTKLSNEDQAILDSIQNIVADTEVGEVLPIEQINEYLKNIRYLDEETLQTILAAFGLDPDIKWTTDDNGISVPKLSSAQKVGFAFANTSWREQDDREDVERYYKINRQLEDQERLQSRIANERERAYGGAKIALIEQEKAALQAEADLLEQKQNEIETNYGQDLQALQEATGNALKLDSNGVITNLEEVWDTYFAYSEENRELLNQYDETRNEFFENEEKLYQNSLELHDKYLEEIEAHYDVQKEMLDEYLDYYEWQLDRLAEDNYGERASIFANKMLNAEANIALNREEIGKLIGDENIDAYLSGDQSVVDNFTDEEMKALITYTHNLRDAYNDLEDAVADSFELLSDYIDSINDDFDDQTKIIDTASKKLQTYKNIIDIVGKDALGITNALLINMAQAEATIANDTLKVAKAKMEANLEMQKTIQEQLSIAREQSNEKMVEHWEKQAKEINDKVNDSTTDFYSAWEEAITAAAELFTTQVELALEGPRKEIEKLQEEYDYQKELSAQYLKDYEQAYELSKLSRDIGKSINDTSSQKAKAELAKLEAEITQYTEKGVKLSKYQTDELRKRYELRLAEIALEEAQNAKSTVRLTRDAEGNYSYTYVADQTKVDEAAQNYEDKLFQLTEFNEKYITAQQEAILKLTAEMWEEIGALRREDYESEAEYQADVEKIRNKYMGMMQYHGEQMELAFASNKLLYDQDYIDYEFANKQKITADNDFAENFQETIVGGIEKGLTSVKEYQDRLNTQLGTWDGDGLLGDLGKAYRVSSEGIAEAMANSGIAMEQFKETVQKAVGDDNTKGSLVESANSAADAINDIYEKVNLLTTTDITSWTTNTSTLLSSLAGEVAHYSGALQTALNLRAQLGATPEVAIPSPCEVVCQSCDESEFDCKETDNGCGQSETYVHINKGPINDWNGDCYVCQEECQTGEDPAWDCKQAPEESVREKAYPNQTTPKKTTTKPWANLEGPGITPQSSLRTLQNIINSEPNMSAQLATDYRLELSEFLDSLDKSAYKSVESLAKEILTVLFSKQQLNSYIYHFDTGGYTGQWGSEGRLAMLHQKELVLNATDTANFLSAIDIMREMVRIIDLNAMQSQFKQLASPATSGQANTVEQNVHIEASFPSVTDHNEIEIALQSLVNEASQYAFRR